MIPTGKYKHYTICQEQRTTRFGAKYTLEEQCLASPTLERRLTPKKWNGTAVSYHLSYGISPPQPISQPTMLEIIKAQENKSFGLLFESTVTTTGSGFILA
jgi:hypothetical protein